MPPRFWIVILAFAAALAAAWLIAPRQAMPLASYLPLHTFLETVSIIVAALIFGVVWNAYGRDRSGNVVILGAGFFTVAIIDFAHTLSHTGMPAFVTPSGTEKSIFFWLAGRFIAAAALLTVALRDERPFASALTRHAVLGALLVLAGAVYVAGLVYLDRLPRTFVEGVGLTPVKVGAEYAVMALFAAAAAAFVRKARRGSQQAQLLFMAAAISVLSELCFTLYSQVGEAFALLGHVYKAAAYLFIYRAVFVASVREPFELLAERESRLARTERLAHVGSWEADLAMQRLHYSDEALRILGVPRAQFAGTVAAGMSQLHPEDRGRYSAAMNAALAGKAPLSLDYRIVRPDGSVRHVHCEDDVVLSPGGVPVRLRGYIQDITERKRAELALAESERRFRALVENASDLVLVLDAQASISYASPAIERIAGYSAGEVVGTSVFRYLHPDDLEAAREELASLLAGPRGPDKASVRRYRTRAGEWRVFESMVKNALDDPAVRGIVINARDVTERSALEQALHERDAGLEQAQRIARLAHVVTGAQGEFVSWSSTLPQIAGVAPAFMPSSTREWLALVHPQDRALFRDACIDAGVRRQASGVEYRLQRPGGRVIHVRQTMVPLDGAGERGPSRWFSTLQDVSELKSAAEQVAAMTRRLVALQEEERRSLARELHDRLGQKLAALSLHLAQLGAIPAAAPRAREGLELVEACGVDVRDLLAELKPPLLAEQGLMPALRLHARELTRAKGLATEVRGPGPRLPLDPQVELALYRIAQAALDNAARHAHARHAEVTLSRQSRHIALEVRDDGVGFDAAGAASAGRWGLSAMRERAEAIGGELRIDTAPGRGTTIRVEFEP